MERGDVVIQRAVGLVLTRVAYFNLRDADWEITPGMHRLDFGVDLSFGDVTVGVTWSSPGQGLDVLPSSIRSSLLGAVDLDVSEMRPWHDIVGRPLRAVAGIDAQVSPGEGRTARWAMAIRFEGSVTIWLAAANYLAQPPTLLPFGDELLVVHDPTVAKRLGLK